VTTGAAEAEAVVEVEATAEAATAHHADDVDEQRVVILTSSPQLGDIHTYIVE
jgi:hypothetical protein